MNTINLKYLTWRAARNDSHALYGLATMYRDGIVVPQDLALYRYFLQSAENQRHSRAMLLLASYYQFGWRGFPESEEMAMYWYSRLTRQWHHAVAQGDQDAADVLEIIRQYRVSKTTD